MAGDACLTGRGCLVAHVPMALRATLIIGLGGGDKRRVRVVAGQAGQVALTFPETGRLAEGRRLMAHVPGICPIPVHPGLGRLAVAGSAERVEFDRVEALGIANCAAAPSGCNVCRTGAVARFAADSVLRGLNGKTRGKRDRKSTRLNSSHV